MDTFGLDMFSVREGIFFSRHSRKRIGTRTLYVYQCGLDKKTYLLSGCNGIAVELLHGAVCKCVDFSPATQHRSSGQCGCVSWEISVGIHY